MASLSIADDLDHTMGSTTRAPNGASGVGSESHWSDADDENDAVWPSLGYLCAPDAGVGWSAAKEHELDGGGRIGEDIALCEEGRATVSEGVHSLVSGGEMLVKLVADGCGVGPMEAVSSMSPFEWDRKAWSRENVFVSVGLALDPGNAVLRAALWGLMVVTEAVRESPRYRCVHTGGSSRVCYIYIYIYI